MEIRRATPDELEILGGMRWDWDSEEAVAGLDDREGFLAAWVSWAQANSATHLPFAAVVNGEIIGMAWLALLSRPPTPHSMRRLDGDVQSVYVKPQWRGKGVGHRLMGALLAEARSRGIRRMSVQSGTRVRSFYRDEFGFGPDEYIQHRTIDR